jgi:hypothetical protein
MDGRVKVGVTALVFGLVVGLSLPSTAQTDDDPAEGFERRITVSGMAIIKSGPDEAVVSLGVQTEGQTAEAALRDNAAKMSKVIEVLKRMGFGEDQLATSSVNLWPNYDSSGRTIVSYTATNQLDVTFRDLSKLGAAIDRAVGAGANLASGISFRVTDRNEGRDRALQAAIEDARDKAEVLAGAADAQVGRVIEISEISSSVPPPVLFERDMVAAEAGTPIEPPTIETGVSVQVIWELV